MLKTVFLRKNMHGMCKKYTIAVQNDTKTKKCPDFFGGKIAQFTL